MDGVRVKLPYDPFASRMKEVEVENGVLLSQIGDIRPSRMRDYILVKIRPFSDTGLMV
jgi:methyl coenzyme M reductase subunit C-like uncharacterized protein (methanogenesis marker protein 7)